MDALCEYDQSHDGASHLEALARRARRERIPLSGVFDLTYRCGLRCSHCYVGHLVDQSRADSGELETEQVVTLLGEAAEAGCLFMTFSGGDPLVRKDFPEIYVAARRLGIVVTIFTNATLVNPANLEALCEYPPEAVDVSLYGSDENTYERITGIPGSFQRAMRGLEALRDRGLRVCLKTMVLRDNLGDVRNIEAFATRLGVDFRLDPRVIPRLDGGSQPLDQRVDPAVAVEVEMDTVERKRELADYYERQTKSLAEEAAGSTERSLLCGAGIASFHLDASGDMRPCLLMRSMAFSAVDTGFGSAWNAVKDAVDSFTPGRSVRCAGCDNLPLCGYCPGLFALESPMDGEPPEYVCRLGEARHEAIDQVVMEVHNAGA